MTKVIKGEFEKIKDVKVEDVSLTCDTSLEVFNNEVNRLSGMDDDSEHEVDDNIVYDPSDVAFIEWRYMMIKYPFNNDEEYVAVKEDEYVDPTITREEACRAYQEIFWKIDERWMVTRAE
ncbi:hypothetical protein Tco_0653918 [Tanacetum coccineum]|uniref:Phage protein n=1 Tax=Tanacetum coccineum TaxID=301880 RepID=A0ABQ4X1R1_9ASTR